MCLQHPWDLPIFTLDQDFEDYWKWLPIRLFAV